MSTALKQNPQEEFFVSLVADSLRPALDLKNITVFERVEATEVLDEALKGQAQHILQSEHPYFVQDLNVAALLTREHDALVKRPLSAILAPAQVSVRDNEFVYYNRDFCEAGQKSEMLSRVADELSGRGVPDSIRADILIIADELITNAVFNAPFVDLENTRSGAPRDTDNLKIPDGKSAHLWLGGDGQRLVVGCRDDFGTLNIKSFLNRIKNCYQAGVAATMRMSGRGGAGIGTFMIFNSSATMFIDVKVSGHTAIYCVLPLKMSSRARLEIPKSIHFRIQK